MKLFCSLPSPFARKVRALAAEKCIALELVVVDVLDPASPVAALNPLRKVPCLVTDDGEAWYDSPVICEWLDALPGRCLIPGDFSTRLAVKRIEALADGVMDAGVAIRLESIYAGRAEHERNTLLERIGHALTDLQRQRLALDEHAIVAITLGSLTTMAHWFTLMFVLYSLLAPKR